MPVIAPLSAFGSIMPKRAEPKITASIYKYLPSNIFENLSEGNHQANNRKGV